MVQASGGTPLFGALFWAVDALLQQREERKLLLVVTDGEPYQVDACKEAIRRCWLVGIEAMSWDSGAGHLCVVSRAKMYRRRCGSAFVYVRVAPQQSAGGAFSPFDVPVSITSGHLTVSEVIHRA